MPVHIDIPEAHAIAALRAGLLVGRARVLGQALLDQCHQRLAQALAMLLGLLVCLAAVVWSFTLRGRTRLEPGPVLLVVALVLPAFAAPKKILVVTVTTGFRHSSIPTAEKILAQLAAESGGTFSVDNVVFSGSTDNVPEPSATALLLGSLAALGIRRRHRK